MLHVSQVAEYGGLTNCVADYVRLQVQQGWHVTVACPPGDLQGLAAAAGAEVVSWQAARDPGPSVAREVLALRRLVAAAAPGVVHLHSSKAGLVGRLVLRGRLPTVFSPHSWSFHAVGGALRRAVVAWERAAARWTGVTVCVSEEERAEGVAAGVRGRYEVIPNAVDVAGLVHAGLDRTRAREDLHLDPAAPTAVCVGRLCRQKGQDVLLSAWGEVLEQVPDARLHLLGDGPDEAEVARAAAGLDHVALAGAVPRDVALAYMVASDLVVLPSRWEGMSLALLEARALGTYVVSTDVAGAREGLAEGGGQVVPTEDPQALAAALVTALRQRPASDAPPPVPEDGDRLRDNVDALTRVYRELRTGR